LNPAFPGEIRKSIKPKTVVDGYQGLGVSDSLFLAPLFSIVSTLESDIKSFSDSIRLTPGRFPFPGNFVLGGTQVTVAGEFFWSG
jgi:hypothetical protein